MTPSLQVSEEMTVVDALAYLRGPIGGYNFDPTCRDVIAPLLERLANPPKHDFWGAGEKDCPREIRAGNGEIRTLRCKVCGKDNPLDDYCTRPAGDVERAARAFEAEALAIASERDGEDVYLQPGLDEMEPEMREAFYRCLRAALNSIGYSRPVIDDELVAKLQGAAVGLCSEDASKYIPRGVTAADCVQAAALLSEMVARIGVLEGLILWADKTVADCCECINYSYDEANSEKWFAEVKALTGKGDAR